MALATISQTDFGAGIHRGRKAPENAVYDAVNALIDDEGLIYKRGGTEYYSASASGAAQTRLHTLYMPAVAATRILTSRSGASVGIQVLDGSLNPVTILTAGPAGWSRPAMLGDIAVFAEGAAGTMRMYGGSLKTANYTTGTVTVTSGSKTVTGVGTSWLANADEGMILTSALGVSVVDTVNSDTSITLTREWEDATAAGAAYALRPTYQYSTSSIRSSGATRAFVARASRYLLFAVGSRVHLIDTLLAIDTEAYHELPAGVTITGLEARGTSALVFTTHGVWEIANLYLDAIDAFGNVQHTVQQISKDVMLWDDYGIGGWSGALVLPCFDDVYLSGPDFSLTPITGDPENEKIRRQYREYVEAGYRPGFAAVHHNHYVLPILNGTTWVDTLICRLDRGAAWTRWAGHAGGPAYAVLAGESAEPKLLGLNSTRVTDLSGTFDPEADNAVEADGTVADLTITTRDYPTGASHHGFVKKARLRYECVDGGTPDPAVALAYSSDQDAGAFSTLLELGEQGGGVGGLASDGATYNWWLVGKRRERIRFRVTVTGACASFVLRSIELLLRPTGRQ